MRAQLPTALWLPSEPLGRLGLGVRAALDLIRMDANISIPLRPNREVPVCRSVLVPILAP
jgi:hypothetical protein